MKAAIFDPESLRVRIENVPPPTPGPDDVLVEICRCGVCGSDVAMTGEAPFHLPAGQFGHEYAGTVIEVGRNVTSHLPGDLVSAIPMLPCGKCANCRHGSVFLCSAPQPLAFGYGEYAALPARAAVRLPSTFSAADGALVEPMACGLHAMRLAGLQPGARVLVIGAGAVALSAIYWARRLGAGSIVVISRSAYRREMVMAVGADAMISFDPDDIGKVDELLGGPPDIVAECVGKAGMIELAAELVRAAGTIVVMGMCMQRELLLPARFSLKETRLIFPMGYSVEEFIATARAFDADGLTSAGMTGEVIGLDSLPSMLETLRAGGGGPKVLVDPARESPKPNAL